MGAGVDCMINLSLAYMFCLDQLALASFLCGNLRQEFLGWVSRTPTLIGTPWLIVLRLGKPLPAIRRVNSDRY